MNILITGAGSGIGYATTVEFAKNGKHKVLAVSRNKKKLDKLFNECLTVNSDAEVSVFSFDIEKDIYTKTLLPFAKKFFLLNKKQTLDILINNAGTLINKPFEELTDKDWQHHFNVNLLGAVKLTRLFMPYMGVKKKGHIVNIGSMGGFQGTEKFPGLSAYSSSKAAIASLSECLAVELKEKNISVNCLALGTVQTDMFAKVFPKNKALLTPEKMAKYIVNFALNGHQFMNGKVLPVAFRN